MKSPLFNQNLEPESIQKSHFVHIGKRPVKPINFEIQTPVSGNLIVYFEMKYFEKMF